MLLLTLGFMQVELDKLTFSKMQNQGSVRARRINLNFSS